MKEDGNGETADSAGRLGTARERVAGRRVDRVRSLGASGEEAGGMLPVDAYPVRGGPPVRICRGCRAAKWSPNGRHLYFSFVGMGVFTDVGTTFVLPIPPGRPLPDLPAAGVASLRKLPPFPVFVPSSTETSRRAAIRPFMPTRR